MEESKSLRTESASQTPYSQFFQWFWQSDPDPWKEKDSTKWTWESYTDNYCALIEDAFSQNHMIVDLGGYEIDFKKMIQVNKKDRNKLRRVKRQVNDDVRSRFLIELPMPSIIDKPQRTINPAFGNVQHFLNFLMKRTPEAYKMYHTLTELSLDSQQNEYEDIVQEVINCIQKGAESREKVIKTRTLSLHKDFLQEAKHIVAEIRSSSKLMELTFRDFLKVILKIYTMESFVCYWLNELLRSENWEEINVLTPYLVCLTYAFQVQDYVIKHSEPKTMKESFLGLFTSKKLTLYRGAALIKEHVAYYHPGNTRFFSWNGVTSTSRSQHQAIKFVEYSMKKMRSEEYSGVLFIIEAEFSSAKDYEGIIDVSKDSKYPEEQEVILAPGTVFEVIKAEMNKENRIYEIRLKLMRKFKENHKLLGDFQKKIILNEKAVLKSLDYEQIIKALQLLEGNQMIEALQIENCTLDAHLVEMIGNMRATTKIKKENITAVHNEITIDSLGTLFHCFSLSNVNEIFIDNNVGFKAEAVQDVKANKRNWKVKQLSLKRETLEKIIYKSQFKGLCERIKDENEIESLSLELKNLPVSADDLNALMTSLEPLILLQDLSLNFELSKNFTDDILENLNKALKGLINLKTLFISFANCQRITDEGVTHLKTGLQGPRRLNNLSLNFMSCKAVLTDFKDLFASMPGLQILSLNYSHSPDLSDERIEQLKHALMTATSLLHLSVNLSYCKNISNQGLGSLKDGLKSLLSLQYLTLDFIDCEKISDIGLSYLQNALEELSSLKNLSFNFKDCEKITDQGMNLLKNGLKCLKKLQNLSLNFENCYNISDNGVKYLTEELQLLGSLSHLSLNFRSCDRISNQSVIFLKKTLPLLRYLKALTMTFENCSKVDDHELHSLREVLIESLPLLAYCKMTYRREICDSAK